jgi:ABC-type amino acid transport substrate-binding protein
VSSSPPENDTAARGGGAVHYAAMFPSRFALFAVAAVLFPLSARAQDLRDLKASGKLRVLAVTVSEGPQFMSPAGASDPGFDAEILAGFARLHGLTVERVSVASWDALAASLLKGLGDLVAGGFTSTAARRETVDFTVEVFPTRDVEYLANLRHSSTWNRLVVKYFGASAPEILRRARE